MHQGKPVFSQLMAYFPLSTFRRCVVTRRGEHKVKDFSFLDQFFATAFVQLTFRESLRDIEVNLRAQAKRLYHMGFRCRTISRNTLANANATRPWQIYADFAQHLIAMARPLYAKEPGFRTAVFHSPGAGLPRDPRQGATRSFCSIKSNASTASRKSFRRPMIMCIER